MLKNLVILTAALAFTAGCSVKKDKFFPPVPTTDKDGKSSPPLTFGGGDKLDEDGDHAPSGGVPLIPPRPEAPKVTGPVSGTADGEMVFDGETKKIEIRPKKTMTINPCDIFKQFRSDGTEQSFSIEFKGEGEIPRVSFRISDAQLVSQIEPYVNEIHERNYAGTKSPLKVTAAPKKTAMWLDSTGMMPASREMDCSLEITPSPVTYRSIWEGNVMETVNKGAKLALSCRNQDADSKVKSIDVAGYCWIGLQTQDLRQ